MRTTTVNSGAARRTASITSQPKRLRSATVAPPKRSVRRLDCAARNCWMR